MSQPENPAASKMYERSKDWSAEWIWSPDDAAAPNSFYRFRREIDGNIGDAVRIHVTSDTHYRLYVDGELIGQGPPDGLPYHKYYDTHLVELDDGDGPHCIGVEVNYLERTASTRGGLLAEVEVDGATLTGTDDTWRVSDADAWTRDTHFYRPNRPFPYQEQRDMRRVPAGWTEAGFDDAGWDDPEIIGSPPGAGPWTRLLSRDIPHMEETPRTATTIEDTHECLWLENRSWDGSPPDISTTLSQSGNEIEHARLDGAANLTVDDETERTTVQSSTTHQSDPTFDGVYDPCVVLDFGRVVTGYFELTLDGIDGGRVDMGFAERLVDGEFNNTIDGPFSNRYVLREGRQTIRSFAWRSFRYVKLRFGKCFDPVQVASARAVLTRYPFEERGGFESDDETLNEVFEISRRTLRLCAHDSIVDSPWREQAQWLGDTSSLQLGGIYSCFGDQALPAKFLRQSASNQLVTGLINNVTNETTTGSGTWHDWTNSYLDYSLWWVMGLWDHYEYTGAEDWIRDFYPHARRVVQAVEPFLTDEGLVGEVPYRFHIDWAAVDKNGSSAVLNGLFYGAVSALERMAELTGDIHTANRLRRYQEDIQDQFQDAFFDRDRACFVDSVIDGQQSSDVSEHANAVALLWGLADRRVADQVVDTLYESESVEFTEAQPFFTFFALRGLREIGRADVALDIVRDRWGSRMVERGLQSTPEEWGTNGSWRSGTYSSFHRTLSHAWSAGPAQFFIHDLTGFTILEPGCAHVALDPADVDLEYDVNIPTPRGIVSVTRMDDSIEVEAADGITVDRNW